MSRWTRFFHRGNDQELDEEIQTHLARAERDRIERGDTPQAAEQAASVEFGNATLMKEVTREMWGWTSFDRFAQDVRYALRSMRRNPGFTLTAVLLLALGIGANTAIFTLIDALLLRSLPVRDPQQLVEVMNIQNGKLVDSFSYPVVRTLADQKQIFSGLCGFSGAIFNVGRPDAVERTTGAWVRGKYYKPSACNPLQAVWSHTMTINPAGFLSPSSPMNTGSASTGATRMRSGGLY